MKLFYFFVRLHFYNLNSCAFVRFSLCTTIIVSKKRNRKALYIDSIDMAYFVHILILLVCCLDFSTSVFIVFLFLLFPNKISVQSFVL